MILWSGVLGDERPVHSVLLEHLRHHGTAVAVLPAERHHRQVLDAALRAGSAAVVHRNKDDCQRAVAHRDKHSSLAAGDTRHTGRQHSAVAGYTAAAKEKTIKP